MEATNTASHQLGDEKHNSFRKAWNKVTVVLVGRHRGSVTTTALLASDLPRAPVLHFPQQSNRMITVLPAGLVKVVDSSWATAS